MLSIWIIKLCGNSVCKPCSIIFNDCLNEGKIPHESKKANVVIVTQKHGVIILNRSNNPVFLELKIIKDLLKSASLWSHPRLRNLNETRNASSPGFFLKNLTSVFESINMGLDHKSFLQIFVIGFCFFCSRIEKR